LGSPTLWRLSIISFVVRHGSQFLHHNFVVALLNDLFGIQARGGCSCAGPYGHRLLGIDLQTSRNFECAILDGAEGVKPGWVRLNFNYFISEAVFSYVLEAVGWIAEHGWKIVPMYRFEPTTGAWIHRERKEKRLLRLHDVHYSGSGIEYRSRHYTEPESILSSYLAEAGEVIERAVAYAVATELVDPVLPERAEQLRWFPMPAEIASELRGGKGCALAKSAQQVWNPSAGS
jgi:hypothetical protein